MSKEDFKYYAVWFRDAQLPAPLALFRYRDLAEDWIEENYRNRGVVRVEEWVPFLAWDNWSPREPD